MVKGVLRTETVFASAPASAGRIPPAYSSVPQFPPSFLEGRGRGRRKEKAATQLLLRGGRRRREVRGEGGGRRGKRPFVNFCFSSSPPPLLRLLLLLLLPGSQFSVSRKGKQGKSEVSSPSSPQPDEKRKKRVREEPFLRVYSHGTAAKTQGPSIVVRPRGDDRPRLGFPFCTQVSLCSDANFPTFQKLRHCFSRTLLPTRGISGLHKFGIVF